MSGSGNVRAWWPEILVCITAFSVLLFRHVVTLDGPMHVLHAAMQFDSWFGELPHADGVRVDADKMDINLGDVLLIGTSRWLSPFWSHALMVACSMLVFGLGAIRLAKAYGPALNGAVLLALPVLFSFPLLLGLFHFLIACGVACAGAAWWVRSPQVSWRTSGVLILLMLLCRFAHEMGPALLILLIGAHECWLFLTERAEWHRRWQMVPNWLLVAALVLVVGGGVWEAFERFSLAYSVIDPAPHAPLFDLLSLRTLLLLDNEVERFFLLALGALLLTALTTAIMLRLTERRYWVRSDALLLGALLFIGCSFVVRSRPADLLYFEDRVQLMALVLLILWVACQRLPQKLLVMVVPAILLLHLVRMTYVERRMALMKPAQEQTLEAGRNLRPHAMVLAVLQEPYWLLRHTGAYASWAHNGICFTSRDHLRFVGDPPLPLEASYYLFSPETEWSWLVRHMDPGTRPFFEQVLVLGKPEDPAQRSWTDLHARLDSGYTRTFTSDYAQVWTVRDDR